MKVFKTLNSLLLMIALIFQPVLAEGLMLHQPKTSTVIEMTHSMPAAVGQSIQNQIMDSDHMNCHEGWHQCNNDCIDGNCNIISTTSFVKPQFFSPTANLAPSITIEIKNHSFHSQSIQPELRPPLS